MCQINPQTILKNEILIPCKFTMQQQVGIDLTIQEEIILPEGKSKNVLLNEKLRLPENVYAMLYGRSSFNREGVLIRGSVYDNGYKGQIGCTVYNMSGRQIKFGRNKRIAQMLFFKADAASEYNGQWQGEHLKK